MGMLELRHRAMLAKKADPFNGYAYVDMGLPSGTLWATMNLGASSVTDDGLFFMWGDTTGYAPGNFLAKDYKYATYDQDHNITAYTKYNSTDNLTVLSLDDDAVHANMGGKWKMPHSSHFTELINNTTFTIVTKYNSSSRTCIVFKSNINNNTLVFPLSGWCSNYRMHTNSYAGYPSSKRYNDANMYYMRLSSSSPPRNAFEQRRSGFTIRGIISEYDIATAVSSVEAPNIMAILYAANLCADPDRMTIDEAANITKTQFNNLDLSTINGDDFSGFKYFTKLTEIKATKFSSKKLSKITIPSTVTSIGRQAFDQCTATVIDGLENVTTLDNYAFNACRNITKLKFEKLSSLGNLVFRFCTSLTTIVCKSSTPPTSVGAISGFTVYVPDDSISAYQADEKWSGCTIKGLSEYTE